MYPGHHHHHHGGHHHGGAPQPGAMQHGGYYFIASQLNQLVLDIEGGHCNPGNRVITWHRKAPHEAANQMWRYCPATKTIRSRANEAFCLDTAGGSLCVHPFHPGRHSQIFHLKEDYIVNTSTNQVLDIEGQNRQPGARVLTWNPNGQHNQRWSFTQ